MAAAFVYFILPAILLLILGLPIFVVLILTSTAAIVFVAIPMQAVQSVMFGSLDNFPLLAVPFFV